MTEKNSRLLAVPLTCALVALPVAVRTALADPADAPEIPSLQEIVVTAQKRSQDIERVPLAITAITGTALQQAGVTSATGLTQLVPGLEVSYNNANTTFAIRGISSQTDATLGDSAVAFEIDGIYEGRPAAASGLFYDINHVEVLRGPQGTLYGRNATAGVVNVITNRPDLTGTKAEGQVELGDYGLVRTFGMVNAPVSSTFGIRAAFQSERHSGYLNSGYDDADDIAGRIQALYQPSEDFSFLLGADYFHQGGIGRGVVQEPLHSDPWQITTPFITTAGYPPNALPRGWTDDKSWMIHAELNWNLGPFLLTDVAAFHYLHVNYFAYMNEAFNLQDDHDREPSNELRISSLPKSRVKWVAGVYYHNEMQPYQQIFFDNAGPSNCNPNCLYVGYGTSLDFIYPHITNPSYAAFGQATFPIGSRFRLTTGVRYNHDHKEVTGGTNKLFGFDTQTFQGFVPAGTVQPSAPINDTASWSHVDWKVGAEWDVTSHTLAYANVATGYKQGGVYAGAPPNTYEPETLTAYELGSKSRLFNNRLQLNADAFYYDYKNYQVDQLERLPSGTGGSIYGDKIFNAAKATEYGVELSLSAAVTRADQFSAALAYLHARFDNFTFPTPQTPPFGPAAGQPPPPVVYEDLSGFQPAHAPEYTASLSWRHTWSLPNEAAVSLLATTHISSYQWLVVDHVYPGGVPQEPYSEQSGYTLSNVNLTYDTASDKASYGVYVRNVENAAVVNNYASSGTAPSVGINAPRTYGLIVTVRFE